MKHIMHLHRQAKTWLARLRTFYRPQISFGDRGEQLAARYLRKKGYLVIETQAKNLYGEVDIIAVDRRTVVFVEVKTRTSHAAGHPAEAVHEHKQQRLVRIALAYLRHHNLLQHAARFDVVAVTWDGLGTPEIEHYENAFEPEDLFQMFS